MHCGKRGGIEEIRGHDDQVLVRGHHHQHWIDGQLAAALIDLDAQGGTLDGVLGVQLQVGPAIILSDDDVALEWREPDHEHLQPCECRLCFRCQRTRVDKSRLAQ